MNRENESAVQPAQTDSKRPVWVEECHPEAKSFAQALGEEIIALCNDLKVYPGRVEWKMNAAGEQEITVILPASQEAV